MKNEICGKLAAGLKLYLHDNNVWLYVAVRVVDLLANLRAAKGIVSDE